VNVRLRRLVAEERRALTQLRQSYAQELRTRTEMELLLRRCVEDIREAIADKYVLHTVYSVAFMMPSLYRMNRMMNRIL